MQSQAADDAADAGIFNPSDPPTPLAFDHGEIIRDYLHFKATGERPQPGRFVDRG